MPPKFVTRKAEFRSRRFVCTGSEFFQNIAFRVDGKKGFNCKKSEVVHLAAGGAQATHALRPKRGAPRNVDEFIINAQVPYFTVIFADGDNRVYFRMPFQFSRFPENSENH